MKLVTFATKNLGQRKVRTGLTIFSIAIAVAVLFVLLSFNKGYEKALKSQMQQMGVHIMVVATGCPFEIASIVLKGGKVPSYLDYSIMDELKKIDGIEIAAPALLHAVVRPDEGRTDIYLGIDETMFRLKNWWKLDGKNFGKEDDMILGYDVSVVELSKTGDKIYIPEIDYTFNIAGVLEPTGTQDDGFFYIPLKTAQKIFKKENKITVVSIRVKDPEKAGEIAEKIGRIRGASVITMSELMGTMMNLMASAKTLMFSIVLITIIISTLGVLNTVIMSVFERTKEIGIMRATGAGKSHVFSLIWAETLIMSVVGGVAGLIIAIVSARSGEHVIRKFLPALSTKQSIISLEPGIFLVCLAFVLGIGICAGVYPAVRASLLKPINALKMD